MIKYGESMNLDEFIRQTDKDQKNRSVFTGDYYSDVLAKAGFDTESSMYKQYSNIAKDIKNNNLQQQLLTLNGQLKDMGLAAQVYPKTNNSGVITGYDLLVYDPSNKDKVLDDKSANIDKNGSYSFVKSFNVAFDDTVKYGHSGINNYVDLLDAAKHDVVRLKMNEAQMKIVNNKLAQMKNSMKKAGPKNSIKKLDYAKAGFSYADDEVKSVELKQNTNLEDKDKDSYQTGSQQIDASRAERINVAPLLKEMEFAYGMDRDYKNKVMEIMALVSQAKSQEEAIKVIKMREADLKKGFGRYGKRSGFNDFKETLLNLRGKELIYDYANNSETAFASEKASTYHRNDTPGDVLANSNLRNQGNKNLHNILGTKKEVKKLTKMYERGVLASRAGEAKGVKYASDVIDTKNNNQVANDAVVLAVEMSDEDLAKQGKANLSVSDGQIVISKDFGKIIDTSHHTINKTFTQKNIEEAKKDALERLKKLKEYQSKRRLSRGESKDLSELQSIMDDTGVIKDINALYARMFRRVLKQEQMTLFKPDKNTADKDNINVFDKMNGNVSVSGEGRVPNESGRKGVGTTANERGAMKTATDKDFEEIHAYSGGKEVKSLKDYGVQVILGKEESDSRKYGSRMKTDITSTLIDMRRGGQLQNFFNELVEDSKKKIKAGDEEGEMQRNAAKFLKDILDSSSIKDGKVYITDDPAVVSKYLDNASNKQLSVYLDYLDTLRDKFGGNQGFGKVYSINAEGNLVRTNNTRTIWTNLGGDNNPQYGKYSDKGAVDFRTGYDSVVRALNIAASNLSEEEREKVLGKNKGKKSIYDIVKELASQFDASDKDKKEYDELYNSNLEAVEDMKNTLGKKIDVKGLDQNKYVTVGKGEGFSIDVDKLETETWGPDQEVINKEKTLTHAIDQQRKLLADKAETERLQKITALEKELADLKAKGDEQEIKNKQQQIDELKKNKITEKDFQVVIDTQGNSFGKKVSYDGGKTSYGFGGRAIYLDKSNGSLSGYDERGYHSVLNNSLVRALQSGEDEKIISGANLVVEEMASSIRSKEGSDYRRLLKNKMSHTMSGTTLGVNTANIMTQEEYEDEMAKDKSSRDNLKIMKSDIASFGVEVSRETVKAYLDGEKPDSNRKDSNRKDNYSLKQLRKMLAEFGLSYKDREGKTKSIDKMTRDEVIEHLLDVLTVGSKDWNRAYKSGNITHGLRGTAARFPLMNGLDVDPSDAIFIGSDIEGKGIRIGAGLARKENADFDGDHEALKLLKMDPSQRILFDKSAELRKKVLQRMAWIAKDEREEKDSSNKVFSDKYDKGVSDAMIAQSAEIASRRNKGATGVFSNFSSQLRNMMRDLEFDETGMVHDLQSERENAASAELIRAYFEAMEQDIISSKKIIKRLVKQKKTSEEELSKKTNKEKKDIVLQEQKNILEEVDALSEKFRERKITWNELTKALADMGIFDYDEDGNPVLNNRVTQNALNVIETSIKGGKEILKKFSGGKYKEFNLYGVAKKQDADFAQSFKDKGDFEEWNKTKEAQTLYKKLEKRGVDIANDKDNSIKKNFFEMLISGKYKKKDFGAVSQETFQTVFGNLAQYSKNRGEPGQDGSIDAVVRAAANKTHIPEKKNYKTNAYFYGELTEEQAEEIQRSEDKVAGTGDAIADMVAQLEDAGGDIGKALAVILKAIMSFSGGTAQAANAIGGGDRLMSAAEGAKVLAKQKYLNPVSTTSITSAFAPYNGISSDPDLVNKIIANKDKKFFGYQDEKQLRKFVGDGINETSALRGNLYGAKTEYFTKLKDVASSKGWEWKTYEDLDKLYDANKDSFEKDADPGIKSLVSSKEEYEKYKEKYFDFLKAVHGENGYNDEEFFLAKNGAKKYEDLIPAWENQIKAAEAFYSEDNRAKIDGKTVGMLPEAGFLGVTGRKGDTSYVGRTDLAALRTEELEMPDGTKQKVNIMDLMDLKTKTGQKLSAGDILQGIMNSFAARQDIAYAKEFEKEGGGGFEAWKNSNVFNTLREKMEQSGYKNVDWEDYYNQLTHADTAVSRILKTSPGPDGKTEAVSLDRAFESLGHKEVMSQVDKFMHGQIPQEEVMKLIQSLAQQMADAGYNVQGDNDLKAKYANATQDEVAADYLKFMKEKNELEEQRKETNYLLKDSSLDKTDARVVELKKQANDLEKRIKQINKNIKIAKETKANLSKYTAGGGKDKDGNLIPEETVDVDSELSESKKEQNAKHRTFVEEAQKAAGTKLESSLERLVSIRSRMQERKVRSDATGLKGISNQQKLLNEMENEKDQKEFDSIAATLQGVDWEKSVGGADKLAEIYNKVGQQASIADQKMNALNADLNPSIWTQLANSVKGWVSQMLRGQLVWKVLGEIQKALNTVIQDAMKLDSVLVDLQIVTGDSRKDTRDLITQYAELAQQMSSTTTEVASAANDWLRQGYSISESIDLVTASLQLSKLGMIDSGKATSYLTSMLKGFKLEASDASKVVDKLTKVDMSAATSAGDIAESLRQFATTAQLSGMDLDQSIAMATTIMDVSQKDASSTGNAIKTMLSRYGNVKAGTYSRMNITGDQNETTESLNDIEKVLKKLGISLRSSNLEFREFDDILDDIAEKWETLDSVSKNAIATAMAGTRQRESFLVLMENYDKYKDFIQEAADAEGTAAEKYKAYEDSLEASQKRLAAAWEELASKTEVVDFLKTVNDLTAQLVKALPIISRILATMFAGKATNAVVRLLGKSGGLKGIGKTLLSSVSGGYFGQKFGWDKKVNSNSVRSGLIDSSIRKGTSPMLQQLQIIAANTGKMSASSGVASPTAKANGMPGAAADIGGKGKKVDTSSVDKSLMSIVDNPKLSAKEKRKQINALYNEKIKENKAEIKKERERLADLKDKKEIEQAKSNLKQLRRQNSALRGEKHTFTDGSSYKNAQSTMAAYAAEPQLSDGTKLSDIKSHTDKNGKTFYTAKGHKGRISAKDYNSLKDQTAANNAAGKNAALGKAATAKAQRSFAAAGAGITAAMTANTSNAHKNQFTGEWETRETDNKNVQGVQRATSGILSAAGQYFLGDLGGMLGAELGNALNPLIANIFPSVREENTKLDRFEKAQKQKKQVEESKSYISNVVDLASKESLTAQDYSSLVTAQDELRDYLSKTENIDLKDEFVSYANKFLAGQDTGNEYAEKSFEQLTDLASMSDSERRKTAYAMKAAQTKQENKAEMAQYEEELDQTNTDLSDDYYKVSGAEAAAEATKWSLAGDRAVTGAGIGASASSSGAAAFGPFAPLVVAAGTALGAVVGGLTGLATGSAAAEGIKEANHNEWNSMTRDEQIDKLKAMKASGQGDSNKLDEMIKKLESINTTIKKIRDKMDQQRTEESILEMSIGTNADGTSKTLLDLSQNALKDMGTDEIIRRLAEYQQEKFGGMADGSSYFYTDENGNKQVTAAARKSILKGLKSNQDIYGAISGQTYRLSEVFGMEDGPTKTETLQNFANALHVSVDELQSLGDTFGNFTLGDLSSSAEELTSKFSNLQTVISNIASGTQSWSTTLQDVTKNYPELLGYASDEYSLSLAMFQKIKDYQKLQTDAQMSDIMSSETYFDTFSDKLKKTLTGEEWKTFENAQINSFNDLQQYIANNDTALSKKLNEAAQQELSNIKLASDQERQALEKVISVKNAQIDKEVSNLTAQKEAMQNINSQREYENKLIEAKLKLESASKEKKRVWREGVGWVYEEDQAAISEAKDNLDSVTNEKAISSLTQQITQLNADKENLSSILSDQEEAMQAAFLQSYQDANGVTSDNVEALGTAVNSSLEGIQTSADEKWDEWMETYKKNEENAKGTLKDKYKALQEAKEKMNQEGLSDEERAKAQESYNTALSDYQSTYNEGLSQGYWKADDFGEKGEMSDLKDAVKAGTGGEGYKKASPDQFVYVKDGSGWNKFVFNPDKQELVNSKEWNQFYDKNGDTGADFYNKTMGDKENGHQLFVNNSQSDATAVGIYQGAQDNTTSTGFAKWLEDNFNGPTVAKVRKSGQWVRFMGGLAYDLGTPKKVGESDVPEDVRERGGSFKEGSLDISKGNKIPLLMNEEGSEAIVTPNGTITALPSHSGILPADITSNLWNLGNYAPDLLGALQRQSLLDMSVSGKATDNSTDNSVNINTVQMTVDADGSFDVDSFVQQLQQVAALTRNNRH